MTLTVEDIMQKDVVTFSPTLGLDVLEQELSQCGVSGAPVVENGIVVGVVSRSDIVKQLSVEQTCAVLAYDYYEAPVLYSNERVDVDEIGNAVGQRIEHLTVSDVMNHTIISISPNLPLIKAANLLLEKKVHRLLVLDDGKLVGILTTTDFVRLYSSQNK